MIFDITDCEKAIGYEFKDKNLLRHCFTHPSYSNENKSSKSNERLEFLGDSVLGFIVSEFLFNRSKNDEGFLTVEKQKYVSGKSLAKECKKLGLNKFLLLGLGNENDREKDSVCENLYESVIAGLYLDGGIEVAKKFICKTILTEKIEKGQDAKSELQIYCQKNKLGIIEYKVLSKSGPDHAPTFKIGVYLGKEKIAEAVGSKKSAAEQTGAKQALNNLKRRK
ncbi:MAG: ribonuclease III [Clostridia bacterium]|nr:ribonuclease III [Clostridia bacterium]